MPDAQPPTTPARPDHSRATLRKRWMVTLAAMVTVFAVFSVVGNLRIGLWGAQKGASQWLTSNHEQSWRGYKRLVTERLEADAALLARSPRLAQILRETRVDGLSAELSSALPLHGSVVWIAMWPDGRVRSNLVACEDADHIGASLGDRVWHQGEGHLLLCGDEALLVASAPSTTQRDLRLFVAQPLNQEFIDGLMWVAKTEVALVGPSGYLASTARNVSGEPTPLGMPPDLSEEIDGATKPTFGAYSLGVSEYGGYSLGSKTQPIAHGDSIVRSYVLAAPVHDDPLAGRIHVVYWVPTFVMDQGPLYSTAALAAMSALLLLVLLWVGRRLVIRFTEPLLALTGAAVDVAAGRLDARVDVPAEGELNVLCDTFNGMVDQVSNLLTHERKIQGDLQKAYGDLSKVHVELQEAQRGLLDASRRAGMADVAASVLHNVGNVMTSVTVSASLIEASLHRTSLKGLEHIATLFDRPRAELDRLLHEGGKSGKIADYLRTMSEELARERTELLREVAALHEHVEEVRRVVRHQQEYARMGGMIEECLPSDVVDDALRLAGGSGAGLRVAVECTVLTEEPVRVDRHKLTQIVVNLLLNAFQSLDRPAVSDARIVIKTRREGSSLVIEIEDNGEGIDAENLERIYHWGFTTKSGGHGFGLHASAIAAREMGGHLRGDSAGPGLGAHFEVCVPVSAARTSRSPAIVRFMEGSPCTTNAS